MTVSANKCIKILSGFITHYEVMNKSDAVEPCRVCVLAAWNELDMMMMGEVDAKSKPWGQH
jgi:hypothetical protein